MCYINKCIYELICITNSRDIDFLTIEGRNVRKRVSE